MRQKLWYHIMTGLGFLLLLGATLFVALRWQDIPAQVATQYGVSGEPTEWADKGSLFGLLATAWIMYILLSVMSFFPQVWNVPGKPAVRVFGFRALPLGNARRSPRALQATADMLALLRVELAGLFSWLLVCTARGVGLSAWFTPVFLGTLGVTLAVGVVRTLHER